MYGRVESTEQITPSIVRVVLGGEGLDGFEMPAATDAYLNLAIAPSGAPYDAVFDPKAVRAEHAREWWPARRRYTVRAWDGTRRLLTIDFVVHGDEGVAGPWARHARPGDVLVFEGPGSGYTPDPGADWYLFAGDESALPAIAASLGAVPAGRTVVVRLVCDDAEHELALETPGRLDLRWLHRRGAEEPARLLLDAVAALELPAGRADVFVHGEADEIRGLRRHLLAERGMDRSAMSCSPYWRRTMTDEAWRAVKADFVASMDADLDAATGADSTADRP
ncbi:siderophore-interacting protein [Nocardioides sp. zg-DK7169]|uniref:siderophore-interacting protein n=1 Tax=Nocardioides sp. zg-DK7169 TaxID=2736600 RepID=UPI0015542119|nr:siderophore-interacting protein [Nocardioides sp. zg-DK7169]NPC96492.1 siderophore-interacting protein [Nocardioides sp. zg-DK7169]